MENKEIEKLNKLYEPLVEYLKNNWDPHCTIIITDSCIKLVRDEIGIPVAKLETAPEVLVQEQYEGKCEHCGHDNDFKLSIGVHLPNGVSPKFCMKCGNKVDYVKKDNLHH